MDAILAGAKSREIFVFRDRGANVATVLESLVDAGFSTNEIEVVSNQ